MLNGLDPIIIFNFKKIPPGLTEIAKIPLVASVVETIDLPAIPIYLSRAITGIIIVSEDKNIDVATDIQTTTDGSQPLVNQRAIGSTITVTMVANKSSIGVNLFSAMAELIFPKLTSKEYSITYMHGAITIFAGLLHSFAITQNATDDNYQITLGLQKPPPETKLAVPQVQKQTGAVPTP